MVLLSLGAPVAAAAVAVAVLGVPRAAVLALALALAGTAAWAALRAYCAAVLPPVDRSTIAFFHPNATGGGGGERVLWVAVAATQRARPDARVVIYADEATTPEAAATAALTSFGVALPRPVAIVPLPDAARLDPARHPRLTLVSQSAAGGALAWAGLKQCVPAVFIDTAGWAAAYPLARAAGATVLAYVHYPIVSTDMLARVGGGRAAAGNDDGDGAAVPPPSLPATARALAKAAYYYAVAALYGAAGGCATGVAVNSGWTENHITSLWWRTARPRRLYPPCGVADLAALPIEGRGGGGERHTMVALAQFRPEKDHGTLLRAWAAARARASKSPASPAARAMLAARLQLIGSVRGAEDAARVEALKRAARRLGLGVVGDRDGGGGDAGGGSDKENAGGRGGGGPPPPPPADPCVEFMVGASRPALVAALGAATAGLHAMREEHFGIGVVEYGAAGAVPIAHDSGGPASDIVTPDPGSGAATGVLAAGVGRYADAIWWAATAPPAEREAVARRARARALQFSDAAFEAGWVALLDEAAPGVGAAG